jgi:integrase
MKGHIRERSPGRWAIVLEVHDPETGKRKRKWHSFKGGKREAQIECARLIADLDSGAYLEPTKTTISAFLDHWLAHIKSQISPRSHERYSEIIAKNVKPAIGAVVLAKLRPAQISAAYDKALLNGRRDGSGGLSPATVVYMHRLIKQALSHAVRWQLLTRNPADAIDPPKLERGSMSTYDMAQTAELLEALRGSRLMIPVMLGVLCGLRRGEIAALRWLNIDLRGKQMSIVQSAEQTKAGIRYKEPKSGRARTVALSTTVADELRRHKIQQSEELLRLGVRQTDDGFVHAREDGHPIQPRSISQAWRQKLATLDLPRIRFHDLRHAHATHLLSSGVHPKIASERLGHSKVGITLDLYSHVLPGMQEDAAARVDEAFQMALKKRAEDIG